MVAQIPQDTLLDIIRVQQEIVETDASLQAVMDAVADAAMRLTHDAAAVEIREGDSMVYRAGTGRAAQFTGLRLGVQSSLSGLCMLRNEALRSDDTEADDRVDRRACRSVGARSMVLMPLRYRENALGVLKVYSSEPYAFDDAAAETLRLLAGLIAATMHRVAEYEGVLHRVMHDRLTGLPNRERLKSALATNIAKGDPFAVVLLDLNGFKEINDAHGHARGDQSAADDRAASRGCRPLRRSRHTPRRRRVRRSPAGLRLPRHGRGGGEAPLRPRLAPDRR